VSPSPPPPHTHTHHTRTNVHRYIPPFGTRRPPQRRSVDYVTVLLPRAAHTPFPVLYVCVCCVCICVCARACVFKLAFMHGYGRFTMFVCVCVRARFVGALTHNAQCCVQSSLPTSVHMSFNSWYHVYVHIYIYAYTNTYLCMYTCMHTYTNVHIPRSLATPLNNHATHPRPHNPPPSQIP
jgi:hypothetical protein